MLLYGMKKSSAAGSFSIKIAALSEVIDSGKDLFEYCYWHSLKSDKQILFRIKNILKVNSET